ncbi:MAG: radical SAM protein [Dehalococcoidales bacterium]|nr:radical SAM protein [Dehalococcoidales bacterium]
MNIRPDDILYSPQLVQHTRNGVYLLIDPASPNWASVNSFGSAVIRGCDGRHTLDEIASSVSGNSPADDVAAFAEQAAEAGFISTTPDISPAYRGRKYAIAPAKLEELWINTNNSCPLSCKHCLVDGGKEKAGPMTTAELKDLVDEAIELGAKRIYFTGGDPFLRKDILPLIKYVTAKVPLVVLTSGVLIKGETAARIKSAANDRLMLQISLEGPDASTNDAIRGKGNYDRAVRGIRALMEAGITPVVTTTLTRLNYIRAAETTRFLAGLGIRDHHILWLHARGRMRQNADELLLPGSEVARVMARLRDATEGTNIIVDNMVSLAARIRGKRGRKNDLCNSCYGVLNVNTDGHVYPCASLCGAAGFDCGSIKEKSLGDIWLKSETTKWIRENSVQKRIGCSSCHLKYFCGGGCFAQSYFNYEMTTGEGCIMAPDPYCEAYKSQITELLWQTAMPQPQEKIENKPTLYRQMETKLPRCAADGNRVLDAAFDVGTYHCSCVLAMDAPDDKRRRGGKR